MEKNASVYEFGLKAIMLLLLLLEIVFVLGVEGDLKLEEKFSAVDRKLKMLNKTPVKSIKSEDGDIIDCIDIYMQPAFDHPALKNHTILMKPKFNASTMETTTKANNTTTTVISQLWQKSGSCPKGTIPIRRIQRHHLLHSPSLEAYGRKHPYSPDKKAKLTDNNKNAPNLVPQVNRSITYLTTLGYNYIGASADLNVWNPSVETNDEYSSVQVWLRNGPRESYESVESGWVVNPKVYGDKRSRLFVYWTVDGSSKTGCYDLTCSGFIQTSKAMVIGGALDHISQYRSQQYHLSTSLNMDVDGNWWLKADGNFLGYFPATLFSLLRHSAIYAMWGGEVYSSRIRGVGGPHTTTQMGSGNYAEGLYGSACYLRQVRIMDYSMKWKFPEEIYSIADEPYCYHAKLYKHDYAAEPEFYFGGPGRNNMCP